ncbi:MAG: hypothetical protein ACOY4D_05440 [Pseudomonadota bacterium]
MPGIRIVAAVIVVMGVWVNNALGGTDPVQPEPGESPATAPAAQGRTVPVKIYVMTVNGSAVEEGVTTAAEFKFYPLNQYQTAVEVRDNRPIVSKLEQQIASVLQPSIQKLNAAVREGLQKNMGTAGSAGVVLPIPDPLKEGKGQSQNVGAANPGTAVLPFKLPALALPGVAATAPVTADMGKRLAQLPYMQKRGVPVAVVFTQSSLSTVYEGSLVNPQPVPARGADALGTGNVAALTATGNFFRSMTGNVKPMTFDGIAKLTWRAEYKIYDVGTGQELRAGSVGPITAVTGQWKGSWYFPALGGESFDEVMRQIADPRGTVMAAALDHLAAKADEAVSASFNDWPDLLQASQELRVGR